MKKISCVFSILFLLIIVTCVAPNKVKAAEDTWYSEAASEVGNPILLEENQYFEDNGL